MKSIFSLNKSNNSVSALILQWVCQREGEGGEPQILHEIETPAADWARAQWLPGLDRQSRWRCFHFHITKIKKFNRVDSRILDKPTHSKFKIQNEHVRFYLLFICGSSFPEEVMLAEENKNPGPSALDGKSAFLRFFFFQSFWSHIDLHHLWLQHIYWSQLEQPFRQLKNDRPSATPTWPFRSVLHVESMLHWKMKSVIFR